MRKISILIFAVLSLLFTACSGSSDVNGSVISLSFHVEDGSVPPQFYSEADLVVTPLYDERTLKLEHSLVYPDRTEETTEQNVDAEGVVGGENFERFEEVIDIVEGLENQVDSPVLTGGSTITINLERPDKTIRIETDWNSEVEGISEIEDFYLDLVNLLAADVKI